jgi:carboxyl-terminal processing protease
VFKFEAVIFLIPKIKEANNNHIKKMSENRDYQVWLPILFSLFVVAGMLIGYNLKGASTVVRVEGGEKTVKRNAYGAGRVEEVLRYVESRYVEEVDREELIEKAIDRFLEELDPHSNYISADELQNVNESLEGNFVGIGVEFDIIKDTILVLSVISKGPSEKLGIMAGDRIVQIEDSIVAGTGMETADVMELLRGEEGTDVTIGIKRGAKKDLLPFTITRRSIPIKSVDVSLMLDSKTGYIKINRFSDTTYDEFMEGLDELNEQGMEDLVLDLRQNPGGYLQQATRILNQIIQKRNEMLVYTEGEHSLRKEYTTKGAVKYDLGDVAILVDEGSASASEIMAGALQDTDRGIVVGRRSFGKGLVQEQYDLSDGSALRLTIARYYTKSGRLIQKSYGDGTDYDGDSNNRFENGELDAAENIKLKDSTEYFTSNGRVVYGGGGIIPDVFVPINQIYKNDDYLVASSHIVEFVYALLDKKRATYTEIKLDDFVNNFELDDASYNDFIDFCQKEDAGINRDSLKDITPELKQRIKSRIARNIYGLKGYYRVRNESDPMILETLEILDDSPKYLGEE